MQSQGQAEGYGDFLDFGRQRDDGDGRSSGQRTLDTSDGRYRSLHVIGITAKSPTRRPASRLSFLIRYK